MIPYVRREKIMEELEKKDLMYIDDFVSIFEDVSESTIRRDLKNLEEENQITVLRGGAVKRKVNTFELPVGTKKFLNLDEKERIAKFAASFVKDEEVIYIDSGTTCAAIVKYIKARDVRIVTSNILVLNELDNPNIISCIIIGGDFNKNLDSISGPLSDNTLKNLYFDRSFLGASGFGNEMGVNTPDIREASKKMIVNTNSKKCYVLADSSKYNKSTLCKAFELNQCILVTDKKINGLEGKIQYYIVD
ncbi:MAG: DeoR/GlpR transcriptional regulator [Neobacillus sp.]|nr:DeoR/GlpR transcriptional regulator [Neobacillus sp.]